MDLNRTVQYHSLTKMMQNEYHSDIEVAAVAGKFNEIRNVLWLAPGLFSMSAILVFSFLSRL